MSLWKEGVVVFAVAKPLIAKGVEVLEQILQESPEFRKPLTLADITAQTPLCGGSTHFTSWPSLQYHPAAVAYFAETYEVLVKHLAPYAENAFIECLRDRWQIRPAGVTVPAESVHIDTTPHCTDRVFGGWINLSDHDQVFTCWPGRIYHLPEGKGFTKWTEPADEPATKVIVPVGHAVVFDQRLLHKVTGGKCKSLSIKYFWGARITHHRESLFGNDRLRSWVDHQDGGWLKSFQPLCTFIPKLYYVNVEINRARVAFLIDTQFQPVGEEEPKRKVHPSLATWMPDKMHPSYPTLFIALLPAEAESLVNTLRLLNMEVVVGAKRKCEDEEVDQRKRVR